MIKKTRLIDIITILYSLINIIYIFFGWQNVHNPKVHFTAFSLIFLGIITLRYLSNKHESLIIRLIGEWYPVLLFGYFFEATSAVNKVVFRDYLDPFFQRIDFLLFGYQPAALWGQRFDNVILQELLHFAYFSYYLMIFGVTAYFYFKDMENFHRHIFLVSFLFYSCYIIYMILPVAGGRALPGLMELTTEYRYGIFTRIMAFIYEKTTHWGGAFPSSHVAVALIISYSSFKIKSWVGYSLLFISSLLTISTVYCHYHYFIDTIFGVFFSIIFFYLGKYIYSLKPVKVSKNV